MSRRRKKEEEHENHERWLVSYADFITLLFAFFVVMYALSSVNEGKYKILSNALSLAFHDTTPATGNQVDIRPGLPSVVAPRKQSRLDEQARQRRERARNTANEAMQALAPMVKSGEVQLTENARGITIDISSNVLFAPGDARLSPAIIPALAAVAHILADSDFPLVVEGHTDNVPINNLQFPSNWELSGTRASTVVRLFVENGVNPGRLSATGFADQRPLESNATAEGRQRNRRVSITIDAQAADTGAEPGTARSPSGSNLSLR